MTMKHIWMVKRDKLYDRFSGTEQDLFLKPATVEFKDGCENWHSHFDEFYAQLKTIFESREDAEAYVRPIVAKAYDMMISDMIANQEDNDNADEIEEYKRRGWKEIRCDELKKGTDEYELHCGGDDRTIWIVPIEHEYDRVGHYFVGIEKNIVY